MICIKASFSVLNETKNVLKLNYLKRKDIFMHVYTTAFILTV